MHAGCITHIAHAVKRDIYINIMCVTCTQTHNDVGTDLNLTLKKKKKPSNVTVEMYVEANAHTTTHRNGMSMEERDISRFSLCASDPPPQDLFSY